MVRTRLDDDGRVALFRRVVVLLVVVLVLVVVVLFLVVLVPQGFSFGERIGKNQSHDAFLLTQDKDAFGTGTRQAMVQDATDTAGHEQNATQNQHADQVAQIHKVSKNQIVNPQN